MSVDSRFIIRETNRRLAGKMSDAEWADFQRLVSVAEKAYVKGAGLCPDCESRGELLVRDVSGATVLCACSCEAGKKRPGLFSPSDKDKERPLTLPSISQVQRPTETTRAEPRRGRDCAFKD